MAETSPIRIVLAKVGLDGHDRGIKVVARALRDAGMHVIYAGLWQTPEAVVRTVADEDADWLGLSILSGAHMTLVPRVLQLLREAGLEHVGVLIGGIIPEADIPKLLAMGVAHVFGPGTPLPDIVAFLRATRGGRTMLDDLLERFRRGDRNALARLLSLVARASDVGEILAGAGVPPGQAGAGGRADRRRRRRQEYAGRQAHRTGARPGQKVAVLACDPKVRSPAAPARRPLSHAGGPDDDGVFIRSLAAAGGHGAVAEHLDP